MNAFIQQGMDMGGQSLNYQNINIQQPNPSLGFQDVVIGFEDDGQAPVYDNTIDESIRADVMNMPTKNQNVFTTQLANVEAINAPYIGTDAELQSQMKHEIYDKPWGGEKAVKVQLQDQKLNYGGADAKVQMQIEGQKESMQRDLERANVQMKTAIQKQQTDVKPTSIDKALALDPGYQYDRHMFKQAVNNYINDQAYIEYMKNPNNKDSSIKKERSEIYAMKPVAAPMTRGQVYLANQRISLFQNHSKLALPQKINNLQTMKPVYTQPAINYKQNNASVNILGMTTPQSMQHTSNQLPPIEYD